MNKYHFKIVAVLFLSLIIMIGSLGCGEDKESPQREHSGKKIVVKHPVTASKESPAKKVPQKEEQKVAAASSVPVAEAVATEKKSEEQTTESLYDPTGKVNPFTPLFQEEKIQQAVEAGRNKGAHKKRPLFLTPLQRVDLTQLKLTGVILSKKGNKALVEETNGKGYVVTVGTYIGIRDGHISKIEKDRIIVDEVDENELGKEYIKKNELKLQKPPGEF